MFWNIAVWVVIAFLGLGGVFCGYLLMKIHRDRRAIERYRKEMMRRHRERLFEEV